MQKRHPFQEMSTNSITPAPLAPPPFASPLQKQPEDAFVSTVSSPAVVTVDCCPGLTFEYLSKFLRSDLKCLQKVIEFLVRQGMHRFATAVSNALELPIDPTVFIGIIDNTSTNQVQL